ncbi:DUF599 domain-containing protein [Rhodobacteraceae bacterium KMM 6894]|nr:DUF599 domain-containing protein [Rhodobacteraceae bacterium KMM 6894]
MQWLDRLTLFSSLDLVALISVLSGWLLIGYVIENSGRSWPSVSNLMGKYRHAWMVQMITRQPRIYDAQTLSSLRQSTAFFASASMLALGGGLAVLGNTEKLIGLASDLTNRTDPVIVWELKLLLVLAFLANAFFAFVWSNRLFGYCAVVMSAVPNDASDPSALPRAAQAADLNISAALSFNKGLRATYFALGSTAWLAGPQALMASGALIGFVLIRREFASESRRILLRDGSAL